MSLKHTKRSFSPTLHRPLTVNETVESFMLITPAESRHRPLTIRLINIPTSNQMHPSRRSKTRRNEKREREREREMRRTVMRFIYQSIRSEASSGEET